MATILYPDGRQEERQPANGHDFHHTELHEIVGGMFNLHRTRDGHLMIVSDTGKLDGLSRNEQATQLMDFPSPEQVKAMLRRHPEILFLGDPDEQDYIVGTVLVCESWEVE